MGISLLLTESLCLSSLCSVGPAGRYKDLDGALVAAYMPISTHYIVATSTLSSPWLCFPHLESEQHKSPRQGCCGG